MRKSVFVYVLPLIFAYFVLAYAAYHHEGEADSPKFVAAYPDLEETKLDSCALCHCGGEYEKKEGEFIEVSSCQWCHMIYGYDGSGDIGETMNPYGKDYLNAGRNVSAFATIEPNDSDEDGYTNKQEIDALSYPGDPTDDPTKFLAPSVTYTLSELESLNSHTQFLLMNTTRSGDWYAEYQGVPVLDLLRDAGMIEETTTAVTAYSPDGYFYTYELKPGGEYYYIEGDYPQAQFYYDSQADKANGGWCDYSTPSCTGRNHGDPIAVEDGLKLILAYKRDGAYLEPGYLDEENRLPLDCEGPFRAVPPQMVHCPPDQASTSENQDVIWPYTDEWDHNAGYSARTVVAIRVEPLPEGTTDFNWYERGWDYVDDEEVIIYGNLASGSVQGTVTDQASNQPIEKATVSTDTGGYSTITDETGSFSLTGMKVATYSIRASAIGFSSSSQSVTVTKDTVQTANFSLSAASPCPVELVISNKQKELALLRNYRDKVLLQSEAGKQYVKSYYVHAAEMVALIISHNEIKRKFMAALNVIKPSIENMMQGYPLAISKAQMRTIEDLTEEVSKVASCSLRKVVCQFEKDIKRKSLSKIFSLVMSN